MSYKQFKELYALAGKKKMTLLEFDNLHKEVEGDYSKMKKRILAIDVAERSN